MKKVRSSFGSTKVQEHDSCPKCKDGYLERVIHRFDMDGGAPDCCWLVCLDCNYETDPE